MCKNYFKGRNGTEAARHYNRSVTWSDIEAYKLAVPPEMRCQLSYFLTNKWMIKDLLKRSMIIQNYHYIEDLDSSAKKLCMSSSGSRVDADSIGYNDSGEWIWSPLIPVYYYSFFPIITTFLAYIEMNHFTYTR